MLGTAQMSLLQNMPFSLCQSGPQWVEGRGNYYFQVFGTAKAKVPLMTLYFLDSHGQIASKVKDPDYDWIKQSQIDWFTCTSQELRKARERLDSQNHSHYSLTFMHIPLLEYGDSHLVVKGGHRREPTEGPSFNSHFYDVLANEGVAAVGCGHDHVNDFCGVLPPLSHEEYRRKGSGPSQPGPWLCYGGGSGFGGYGSYGGKRYHRRLRVWELDANADSLKTWKRVEYIRERVDELVLMQAGAAVAAPFEFDQEL